MKAKTMKSSPLSRYIDQRADNLGPEKKQLLARLSDDAIEQAHTAFFKDAEMLAPPDNAEDMPESETYRRDRMRHNVPALNSLSDTELDLALDVASQWFRDAMAAEERIAETGEYMTEEEYERMANIARGVA